MKFSNKDFISKCDQIRSSLRIWLQLLKQFLMQNLFFCAVVKSTGIFIACKLSEMRVAPAQYAGEFTYMQYKVIKVLFRKANRSVPKHIRSHGNIDTQSYNSTLLLAMFSESYCTRRTQGPLQDKFLKKQLKS